MKSPCQTCNGTGQVSFFKGVSRFLLSEEECPECGGVGFVFPVADDPPPEKGATRRPPAREKKER